MNIDLYGKITPNFTWKEMLYCPQWGVCVFPISNHELANIVETCEVLEQIRDILNSPLKVLSGYRPRKYNQMIGGSVNSYHMQGLAADVYPTKVPVDKAKLALRDFLDELQCRMEDIPGGWIHIDLGMPGPSGRFFKP